MNVRNCRKCGRLFNYAMGPLMCPQCREALEEKFKEVKAYISEHSGCGIQEVSRECDVEVSQIQQWLREERLQFSEDSMVQLTCESCGTTIRSGRFCEKCKNEMANGFQKAITPTAPPPVEKKETKDAPRMRFLN
ncbi:MAG: flagellar protein [Lachnospiraceae bacterium]|nr:flagellar protein [Lachnospiraceae bacterium]